MYLGRIVGVGLSPRGVPFAVYGVTGRSEKSQRRLARISDDGRLVRITPIDALTPEQEAIKDLLIYTAFRTDASGSVLFVTNGSQTDRMVEALQRDPRRARTTIVEEVLDAMGAEPDDPIRTPRIAASIDGLTREAVLGTVTRDHAAAALPIMLKEPSQALCLATYTGDDKEPAAPTFENLRQILRPVALVGESAEELAGAFYAWLEMTHGNYIVCTAAAYWNERSSRWDYAVRNRHARSAP